MHNPYSDWVLVWREEVCSDSRLCLGDLAKKVRIRQNEVANLTKLWESELCYRIHSHTLADLPKAVRYLEEKLV
jgi:hypothetical protein